MEDDINFLVLKGPTGLNIEKNDLVNVVHRLAHDVLQRDVAKRQFQNMQKQFKNFLPR